MLNSKKIISLITASLLSLLFCSCGSSSSSVQKDDSKIKDISSVSETEKSSETPEQAKAKAELLFNSAQEIADRYSTAGATIRAEIFTDTDMKSGNAEKLNFLAMLPEELRESGKWAFKMEKFHIVSAVYSPEEGSDIIIRYPEEYTGSTDNITDLSSLL